MVATDEFSSKDPVSIPEIQVQTEPSVSGETWANGLESPTTAAGSTGCSIEHPWYLTGTSIGTAPQ